MQYGAMTMTDWNEYWCIFQKQLISMHRAIQLHYLFLLYLVNTVFIVMRKMNLYYTRCVADV